MTRVPRVFFSLLIGAAAIAAATTVGEAQVTDFAIAALAPVGGTTVSGSAILRADGEGTSVDLSLSGLVAEAAYTTRMHAGTCDLPSASFSELPGLTAGADGTATVSGDVLFRGTDPVALASMADGEHVIVVSDESSVVACGVIPMPVAYSTPRDGGAASTIVVPLAAATGGSAAGTATLAANGEGTSVALALTGLAAGGAYSATMHAGTCAQPSASFAVLPAITADAGGAAAASGAILFRGTDPVALEAMTDGDHVIVIAGSTGVVACGVIPAAAAAPAATGNAGLAHGASSPAALGVLAVLAVLAGALGARRITARRSR